MLHDAMVTFLNALSLTNDKDFRTILKQQIFKQLDASGFIFYNNCFDHNYKSNGISIVTQVPIIVPCASFISLISMDTL